MARKSIYSDAQWRWIADRYKEGYDATELAEFLGVWECSIYRHMRRLGVKRGVYKRPPLRDRAREFNALR